MLNLPQAAGVGPRREVSRRRGRRPRGAAAAVVVDFPRLSHTGGLPSAAGGLRRGRAQDEWAGRSGKTGCAGSSAPVPRRGRKSGGGRHRRQSVTYGYVENSSQFRLGRP